MKTVGILGGFGPESTAKFQLEIVDIFRAKKIKTRPPILIWNTPIPLKIERNLILKSEDIREFLPFLVDGAERLDKAGADFLVIPCNTLHILMGKLQPLVKLPILSIIEETANTLSEKGIKTVGIIGTELMVKSNIHQNSLQLLGIQPVLPSQDDQDLINQCINLILANKNALRVEESLSKIIKKIETKGVKDILLACTDLKPFIKGVPEAKIHDTLQILAKSTVEKMIGE